MLKMATNNIYSTKELQTIKFNEAEKKRILEKIINLFPN
jgi:hypothetical protein